MALFRCVQITLLHLRTFLIVVAYMQVITKKAGHAVAFITSFINSAIMTMVTEIGDKTFCIAAIMAMRSNRWAVFIGCVGALLIMTFLSVVIGVAVPTIFSPEYTHYISILLFVYFGIDMLREGAKMDGHAPNDELAEAEEELAERGVTNTPKERVTEVTTEEDVSEVHETAQLLTISTPTNKCVTRATVAGGPDLSPAASDASEIVINVPVVDDDDDIDPGKKLRSKSGNFFTNLWREKAVLTQAFTIIFFAEWGDKSQIATIAMASSQNPWGGKSLVCFSFVRISFDLCHFSFFHLHVVEVYA